MFMENNPLGVSSIDGQFDHLRKGDIEWTAIALFMEAHEGHRVDWWPGRESVFVNLLAKFKSLPPETVELWRSIAAVVLSACPELAARAGDEEKHRALRTEAFVQRAKAEQAARVAQNAKAASPIPLHVHQYKAMEKEGLINESNRQQFKKVYTYLEMQELCTDMSLSHKAEQASAAIAEESPPSKIENEKSDNFV